MKQESWKNAQKLARRILDTMRRVLTKKRKRRSRRKKEKKIQHLTKKSCPTYCQVT